MLSLSLSLICDTGVVILIYLLHLESLFSWDDLVQRYSIYTLGILLLDQAALGLESSSHSPFHIALIETWNRLGTEVEPIK